MRIGEAVGGAAGASARTAGFEKALQHASGERTRGVGRADEASGSPGGSAGMEGGAAARTEGGCPPERSTQQAALAAMERVADAQQRLDSVLRMASAGKGLSAAALLAMQADVYRSSQLLELAGKVVERATSGVKQVLTTQL